LAIDSIRLQLIAGNNLLVKTDFVINTSADFNACSGTSAVPDSMMMGVCGFSHLISFGVHAKKVMDHASPGSDLGSQRS